MGDTVMFYTGVVRMPEQAAQVRRGAAEVASSYAALGVAIEFVDDMPAGTLAVLGYREPDGSFKPGAVRIVEA